MLPIYYKRYTRKIRHLATPVSHFENFFERRKSIVQEEYEKKEKEKKRVSRTSIS